MNQWNLSYDVNVSDKLSNEVLLWSINKYELFSQKKLLTTLNNIQIRTTYKK